MEMSSAFGGVVDVAALDRVPTGGGVRATNGSVGPGVETAVALVRKVRIVKAQRGATLRFEPATRGNPGKRDFVIQLTGFSPFAHDVVSWWE